MDADDISKLVEVADNLVYEKTGQHLEAVDKDILRQALIGKKLSAIQSPSYENSYVQRSRAPRLWDRLSVVAGEKVRKKTILEVLQRFQQQRSQLRAALQSQSLACVQTESNAEVALNGFVSCPELRDGSTTLKKPDSVEPYNPNPSAAALPESEKRVEDCLPCSTAQEFQSSSQTNNSTDTKSSAYDLSVLVNFIKPGMPLLLSLGILSCLFSLSWLANWYGVTNHSAGQLPKAQLAYSLALKLNPSSAAAHYNQGATYEDQQDYERAHAEYQLAIEGGLVEAYNNQARLYIREKNYNAAVSLLRIGLPLAKDPRVRADMYKNRGWARLEQGRYDEAKLDLVEAIKLRSDAAKSGFPLVDRAPTHCLMAQVLERQVDKKSALLEWENCLRFAYQPNTPEEDTWVDLARQHLSAK